MINTSNFVLKTSKPDFTRLGELKKILDSRKKPSNVYKYKKQPKSVGTVQRTRDYDMFETITGNRKIEDKNVNKIKKSIDDMGFVDFRPIIVTKCISKKTGKECLKVIDGQHRLDACRKHNKLVYYQIIDIEECDIIQLVLDLNRNKKKWEAGDYVKHFAKKGVDSYVKVMEFNKRYKFGISLSLTICCGYSVGITRTIEMGNDLNVTENRYEVGDFLKQCITFLPKFAKTKIFACAVIAMFNETTPKQREILSSRSNIMAMCKQPDTGFYLTMFRNIIMKAKKR